MTCGIYQILNTVNGQSFVGHARNIERRWWQHTADLDKASVLEHVNYPLKTAFLNAGLSTAVTKPGRTRGFEFFIAEECSANQLLERQRFWIDKLQPTYNGYPTQLKDSDFQSYLSKSWVFYHNVDKIGGLPFEFRLDEVPDQLYLDDSRILTLSIPKRSLSEGDMIYTIVGIGQKPKQYYLWSYLIVEEIHPTAEAGRISYQVLGDGWLLASPPFLNSSTFNSFKKSCGNFSAGMVAIRNSPYPNTLQQLAVEQQPQDTTTDFWKLVEHFYAQASSKHPKDAEILCKQGLLKYKRGNDRQAIQLFTQALTLSPNFAQAYYYRGLAYCQLNEIAAAIADLQVAVDRLRDAKPQPPLYQLAQELLLELD